LPGAGAGLLGLQERVALAGGTLVLGPDGSGDFVVEAELTWRA
jgi:signal transduction histidine kinase